MTTVAFTNEQVTALKTMRRIWSKEQIVLIGASALGRFIDMRWFVIAFRSGNSSVPIAIR
jgi:hypothetical protein